MAKLSQIFVSGGGLLVCYCIYLFVAWLDLPGPALRIAQLILGLVVFIAFINLIYGLLSNTPNDPAD